MKNASPGAPTGAPSIKPLQLSHRTASPAETLNRLRAMAALIPISRIADLTHLDALGLPIFSATTPLARDLTTHMGKGLDPCSAEVSAMAEAVERVSAECAPGSSLRMSFEEMRDAGKNVANPRDFELPDDSAYDESRAITWVEGRDVIRNEATWLPLDLAINPPSEGVLRDVDTNGLAAGNTQLEAVVHGLCEVIERDALGQHLFVAMFGDPGEPGPLSRRMHLASLPESARSWLERISECGLSIEITCIRTEIPIPVFRAVLVDHAFPVSSRLETRRFVGAGASPNAELGVLRAITEAVQSRVAIVLGARDSFNAVSAPPRFTHPSAATGDIAACQRFSFDEVRSFASDDLSRDFEYLLERLRDGGVGSAIVVDLTQEGLGLPVVRVRVPGLTSFLSNRRRAGWRCKRYLL